MAELAGGFVFGSLALTADAVHMFSDAFALAVAFAAQRIAVRPPSATHSFGWRRAEVLAAFANGLLLLLVSAWIVYEALRRIASPADVDAAGLTAVATVGLGINLFCFWYLRRNADENLNVRAAALHTAGDAAGSVGALLVGLVLLAGGPHWSDPLVSILISVLVIYASMRLLKDAVRVLLEAAPDDLDPGAIEAALNDQPSVIRVHHLHVWTVAPGSPALSAHIELQDIDTLHEAQREGQRLKKLLHDRFDLRHATLELECHPCDPHEAEH